MGHGEARLIQDQLAVLNISRVVLKAFEPLPCLSAKLIKYFEYYFWKFSWKKIQFKKYILCTVPWHLGRCKEPYIVALVPQRKHISASERATSRFVIFRPLQLGRNRSDSKYHHWPGKMSWNGPRTRTNGLQFGSAGGCPIGRRGRSKCELKRNCAILRSNGIHAAIALAVRSQNLIRLPKFGTQAFICVSITFQYYPYPSQTLILHRNFLSGGT